MIDPENIKDSVLDSIQWTEQEMKEFLRPVMRRSTKMVAFDPYEDPRLDVRTIRLKVRIACATTSQPDVLALVRRKIEGSRIKVSTVRLRENMLVVTFTAPRFKPIEAAKE